MFDREKFKRLVHYVIAQAGDRPGFGAVKLNKVLWFAEARQFMLTGKSITGATFLREKYGPVPRVIMPVRDDLQADGLIKCYPPKFEYEGWRFRSLAPAPGDFLTDEERQTVRWWIEHISNDHTASSISEESHDYGWEIAKIGEILPLHAFLAERVREPTEEELAWAKEAWRARSA